MIAPPRNVRGWLACGHTDMRRGFDGLSSPVQQQLGQDRFSDQLLVFRGRRNACWQQEDTCSDAKPCWKIRTG